MYEVTIRKTFSAAHVLKESNGQCEDLHGHNFIVEVSVAGKQLNHEDLLIDFRVLKGWINETLFRLDHKYLNDIEEFRGVNPSSELIAKLFYDELAPKAAALDLDIPRITVWESEDARVTYEKNKILQP
ncbi:MAG: 6-carboxytetrahydropterin synthase QueD [Syntrophales bacterium]|nr:6-carboxytetrahydropterin synthase QueD [Syntrophales bacterium]